MVAVALSTARRVQKCDLLGVSSCDHNLVATTLLLIGHKLSARRAKPGHGEAGACVGAHDVLHAFFPAGRARVLELEARIVRHASLRSWPG